MLIRGGLLASPGMPRWPRGDELGRGLGARWCAIDAIEAARAGRAQSAAARAAERNGIEFDTGSAGAYSPATVLLDTVAVY